MFITAAASTPTATPSASSAAALSTAAAHTAFITFAYSELALPTTIWRTK